MNRTIMLSESVNVSFKAGMYDDLSIDENQGWGFSIEREGCACFLEVGSREEMEEEIKENGDSVLGLVFSRMKKTENPEAQEMWEVVLDGEPLTINGELVDSEEFESMKCSMVGV